MSQVHVAEQRQPMGPFEVSAPLPLREPTPAPAPRPRRARSTVARPPEPVRQQALFG